jgi:soluble P-type ATPase
MIKINIPGGANLSIEHLVLDYNGTLACDGKLLQGVEERLGRLAGSLKIHVLTADTFGKAADELQNIPCELVVLPEGRQDRAKQQYVQNLGVDATVCIGNGQNDRLMIEISMLGIALVLDEGAAAETIRAADVICTSIASALDLFLFPRRLIATLRIE